MSESTDTGFAAIEDERPIEELEQYLKHKNLPQPGVLDVPPRHGAVYTIKLREGYDRRKVIDVLFAIPRSYADPHRRDEGIPGLIYEVDQLQSQHPDDRVFTVVAFAPELWRSWSMDLPEGTPIFHGKASTDGKHAFPKLDADLLLHVKSSQKALCERIVALVGDRLASEIAHGEVTHVTYESRNDMGFFDADPTLARPGGYQMRTMNPVFTHGQVEFRTDRGRAATALLSPTNASFLMTHKFVHHRFEAFTRMDAHAQSAVIGRDKESGLFLERVNHEHPFAHVIRSFVVRDDGEFGHIYRQGGGFPGGLYFMAYTNDAAIFDVTLDQMLGNIKPKHAPFFDDEAGSDMLLEYTRSTGGNYWYVPGMAEIFTVYRRAAAAR